MSQLTKVVILRYDMYGEGGIFDSEQRKYFLETMLMPHARIRNSYIA